jgi:hypothetical protein
LHSDELTEVMENGSKEKRNKWKEVRKPDENEERKMMGKILKITVLAVMGNHMYRFNGKVYLQQDGGQIRLEVTQALARVVMRKIDKLIKMKFDEEKIVMNMYGRYIDDANFVVVPPPLGTRVEDGKLVVKMEKVEKDRGEERDRRTARILRELTNGLSPMIQ